MASLPGYQFGDITEAELSQDQELDEQNLDDQGRAVLSPENRWSDARSPLRLILQASLQESGGRPITRRLVQPVWPAERLPGVRGLFEGEEVDADSLAEFEILVADAAGNKLAADNLNVRLVRERRDYFWAFSDGEGWRHNYNEKFLTLSDEPLKVAAGGTAKVSFPVEWGPYRVEVVDNQTGLISSLRFWAGYRWQDNADGGAVRPDQVKLALDKPAYAEGDVARITVTPPAAGNGYLLVESSEDRCGGRKSACRPKARPSSCPSTSSGHVTTSTSALWWFVPASARRRSPRNAPSACCTCRWIAHRANWPSASRHPRRCGPSSR